MAGPSHGDLPAQEHARDAEGPYARISRPRTLDQQQNQSRRTCRRGIPTTWWTACASIAPGSPEATPRRACSANSCAENPNQTRLIPRGPAPQREHSQGVYTRQIRSQGGRNASPASPRRRPAHSRATEPNQLGLERPAPVFNRQGTDPAQRYRPKWQALLRDRNSALAMPRPSIANAPSPLRVRPYEVTRIAVACRGRGPVLSTHA